VRFNEPLVTYEMFHKRKDRASFLVTHDATASNYIAEACVLHEGSSFHSPLLTRHTTTTSDSGGTPVPGEV